MAKSSSRRKWLWGTVIALTVLVAPNWNGLMLMSAIAVSERRPALLSGAEWNNPASARAFNDRFPPGTPKADLIAWLEVNNFAIDRAAGRANRLVKSLPCDESIQVDWTTPSSERIGSIEVRVAEAGCL